LLITSPIGHNEKRHLSDVFLEDNPSNKRNCCILMVTYLFISYDRSLQERKMTEHKNPIIQTKRSEAYENLISSLDTENDLNDVTLENLTNLDFDR
jgi:hypothetical protein